MWIDSDSDDSDIEDSASLQDDLRNCFLEHNVTQACISSLLKVLKKHLPDLNLPIDARTLLKTKTITPTDVVHPGEYWHSGIAENLKMLLKQTTVQGDSIFLNFSIDGLPISRSSKGQFWPILGTIEGCEIKPFLVGLYYGHSKPNSSEEFLRKFINEMKDLTKNGIIVGKNNANVIVRIRCFICDAPARAFLKGIKGHNSYYGCEKCVVEGTYFHSVHHVSYDEFDCELRTNGSFRNRLNPEHHNLRSPLEDLEIDMVNIFPLDYMHLILLGITKKMLLFWVKGNKTDFKTKFSAQDILEISRGLLMCGQTLPAEINRAIRPLDVISFWKATEFRTFLLKTGPIVLKGRLPQNAYNNFLALHCAVTICSSNSFKTLIPVAEQLFKDFLKSFIAIYGQENVTYNFHSLSHLIADVKRLGNLDSFGAFPYESSLCRLKSKVHSGNKPLQQVARRTSELLSANAKLIKPIKYPILKKLQYTAKHPIKNPLKHPLNSCKDVYHEIQFQSFILNTLNKNKWFLSKNHHIVAFLNATFLDGEIFVYGSVLKTKNDLYSLPLKSSRLHIYESDMVHSSQAQIFPISDIFCKLFCITNDPNSSAFFPLLHTIQ